MLDKEVIALVAECLQVEDSEQWDDRTELLGSIPELDSMAIVTIITTMEENYGFTIDDDEISAEVFETVGALTEFVKEKLA